MRRFGRGIAGALLLPGLAAAGLPGEPAEEIRRTQEAILVESGRLDAAMERLARVLREGEPENSIRLARGLSLLRGSLVQDVLRKALEDVKAGRYPEALERQTEALRGLESILGALEGPAEDPRGAAEEALRRAAAFVAQVEGLAAAERGEIGKLASGPPPKGLPPEAEGIRRQELGLARRLAPHAAVERARRLLEEAKGALSAAGPEGPPPEAAERLARAAAAARAALDRMREAAGEGAREIPEDLKAAMRGIQEALRDPGAPDGRAAKALADAAAALDRAAGRLPALDPNGAAADQARIRAQAEAAAAAAGAAAEGTRALAAAAGAMKGAERALGAGDASRALSAAEEALAALGDEGPRPDPSDLARIQEALRSEALRLAEQAKEPERKESREGLSEAASSMGEASKALAEGDRAEGRRREEEALSQLERSRQHALHVLEAAREQVRGKAIEDLKSILAEIDRRQKRVIGETERWGKDAASPRARELALRTLADEEGSLGRRVLETAERSAAEGGPAFSEGLASAERDLRGASERLARGVGDDLTLEMERDASRQIGFLLEVLADAGGRKAAPPSREDGEEPPKKGLLGRDAEIRLLKRMEERLLERVRALETALRVKGLDDPDRPTHLTRLRSEQERIRFLTERLAAEEKSLKVGEKRPKKPAKAPRPEGGAPPGLPGPAPGPVPVPVPPGGGEEE